MSMFLALKSAMSGVSFGTHVKKTEEDTAEEMVDKNEEIFREFVKSESKEPEKYKPLLDEIKTILLSGKNVGEKMDELAAKTSTKILPLSRCGENHFRDIFGPQSSLFQNEIKIPEEVQKLMALLCFYSKSPEDTKYFNFEYFQSCFDSDEKIWNGLEKEIFDKFVSEFISCRMENKKSNGGEEYGRYGRDNKFDYAVSEDDGYVFELLLGKGNIDVNGVPAGTNFLLLCDAIVLKRTEIVKLLLAHPQIDVNKRSEPNSNTPLTCAAYMGQKKIVELLLKRPEIKVNSIGLFNHTPLTAAIRTAQSDIVDLLLKHPGIDVNKPDGQGTDPFMTAFYDERRDIFKLLREHKGFVYPQIDKDTVVKRCDNTKSQKSLFPLATESGHPDLIKIFDTQQKGT